MVFTVVKCKWVGNKNMQKNQKKRIFSFLNTKWDGSPRFEALRFIAVYVVVGILWIMFSDRLLVLFISDWDKFINAQLIKGIFYVFATGGLFYLILKARLQLLEKLNQELIYQATHDKLTAIPNKEEFGRRLNAKIAYNKSHKGIALVYLDIDNFSNINELMHYSVGDELLIEMKNEILNLISKKELKGRDSGGYVFTITYDIGKEEQVNKVLDEMLQRINEPWFIEGNKIMITCSMGVALYPKDGKNFHDLYSAADIVLHDVKENKRNTYAYFESEYIIKRHEKINMIHELKEAIIENQLSLVYQPIYLLSTKETIGYEALLRWESKTYGKVPPNIFITYSENIGMFLKIEEWVFDQAMKLIKKWNSLGDMTTSLSVNLSASGLINSNLINKIKDMNEYYKINSKQLEIEITETALIKNVEVAIENLNQLRAIGCPIALDDFGSGYSSLMYLQRLPINTVKIDKVFTHRIQGDPKEELVFTSVIELSKQLGLSIVVEGIETEIQHEYLSQLSIEYGQGYFYSYPLPEAEMMQRITKKRKVIQN